MQPDSRQASPNIIDAMKPLFYFDVGNHNNTPPTEQVMDFTHPEQDRIFEKLQMQLPEYGQITSDGDQGTDTPFFMSSPQVRTMPHPSYHYQVQVIHQSSPSGTDEDGSSSSNSDSSGEGNHSQRSSDKVQNIS